MTTVAGRYRLERELGQGGMATVHLARDLELDRPVALKILAENPARDEEIRGRFMREARFAAQLANANAVRIFDAGEDAGRPFIVMEYVDGETVAELAAREGRLSPATVVGLGIQVCNGLAAAHDAGLVHRDVKPANLLLARDGTLKVADFGIARSDAGTQVTAVGSILGTAGYLAPEQAAGEPVTAAADLYSLGAVLYELLTGSPPRDAETLGRLLALGPEPPVPVRELAPEVPPELEQAVMRCLEVRPDARPRSAGELAGDLAAAVPEAATAVLPPPAELRATEVTERPVRFRSEGWRGRVLLGVAILVALLAIVLGLASSLGGGSGGGTRSTPTTVPLPAPAPSAAQDAHDFAAWLRRNSG